MARDQIHRIRNVVDRLHIAITQELGPEGCGQLVRLLRRADTSLAAPVTDPWWPDP